MFNKRYHSWARALGCCGCFGFSKRKPKQSLRPISRLNYRISQELLLDDEIDDEADSFFNGEDTNTAHGDDGELQNCGKHSEEILRLREQNGLVCRQYPVKETNKLIRSEVSL